MKPANALIAILTLAGATVAGVPARAQEQAAPPATAEDHLARAAAYDAKAAAYRKEAAMHREMLEDYQRRHDNPALQSKSGRELPWIAEMRKHCKGFIADAERLATDAEGFAKFHRMRAEELRGK